MPRWYQRFQRAERAGAEPSASGRPTPIRGHTLELIVLEGEDAGGQFTLDGEEIAVGRGAARTGQIGAICLSDPTVSPRQAVIRVTPDGAEIEHREGATNPTFVNGRPVGRHPITTGDRVQMGHIVFEVRARGGITLSGLVRIPDEIASTQVVRAVREPDTTTEVRGIGTAFAYLTLVRGIAGWEGKRFPLEVMSTKIGRNPGGEIVIPENGVSRVHAEILWERGRVTLVHRSATNATYLNGVSVDERCELDAGDLIQLADRVLMRFDPAEKEEAEAAAPEDPADHSLRAMMEEKILHDQQIEREFGFRGSFLDVDVVDSHGLKVRAQRPEHIVVSFERFRNFARRVVEEFGGHVLNSNGDELMCYFEQPIQAVRAASAIIARLEEFNGDENLLGHPFRVRQGIHTGQSLVDRERGYAYSAVLDTAGHLQKHAPENGVLVSRDTLDALPEDLPFEPAGEVGREAVPSFRLTGSI